MSLVDIFQKNYIPNDSNSLEQTLKFIDYEIKKRVTYQEEAFVTNEIFLLAKNLFQKKYIDHSLNYLKLIDSKQLALRAGISYFEIKNLLLDAYILQGNIEKINDEIRKVLRLTIKTKNTFRMMVIFEKYKDYLKDELQYAIEYYVALYACKKSDLKLKSISIWDSSIETLRSLDTSSLILEKAFLEKHITILKNISEDWCYPSVELKLQQTLKLLESQVALYKVQSGNEAKYISEYYKLLKDERLVDNPNIYLSDGQNIIPDQSVVYYFRENGESEIVDKIRAASAADLCANDIYKNLIHDINIVSSIKQNNNPIIRSKSDFIKRTVERDEVLSLVKSCALNNEFDLGLELINHFQTSVIEKTIDENICFKERLDLSYYKIIFLKKKGMLVSALEELDQVLYNTPINKEEKLCFLYLKAEALENIGQKHLALNILKTIYKIDSNYRMVGQRLKQTEQNK